METIADLIEAARKRTGATYTDISERLDRSKQLITNWKSGKKVPTDGDVLALARMAGENADKWLAIAQAARTEGEAKTRWEQIARKLATVGMALALAIGLASPANVQAAEVGVSAPQSIHYAKWLIRLFYAGSAGSGSGSGSILTYHPGILRIRGKLRHERHIRPGQTSTVLGTRQAVSEQLRA